jgi:hypothetical protein
MSDLSGAERIDCPYLGKVDDRHAVYSQATRRHRCYRWEQALPIRRQDQEQYCLSPLHVTCPRLTDPNALPVPEVRRRTAHRSSARILGMPVPRFLSYAVPMLLLFIAAVVASYVLVQHMAPTPLPIAFIPTLPGTPQPTHTATATPFPTWTPVGASVPSATPGASETATPVPVFVSPLATPTETATRRPTATRATAQGYAITPTDTPEPVYTPEANPVGTSTFSSPFDSPIATPPAETSATETAPAQVLATETVAATATGTTSESATADLSAPFNFMAIRPPTKTLLPGGVDVCAKVYGRVYDLAGNNITKQVAVSVTWWPDNRLVVGAPGSPPINPDGTYEFCLTRGQFNVAVVATKKTSEQFWIDTDEPNFTGKVIIELNFKEVR